MWSLRPVAGAVLVILLVGLATGLFLSRGDSDDDALIPVAPTAATPATATPTPATPTPATPTPATPTPATPTAATPTAATPTAATPTAATPTAATPTAAGVTVYHDPSLALIWTTPRGLVFEKVGDSVALTVQGRYSDGTEHALPDQPGRTVVFSSFDPSIATIDSSGLITAVAPGGVDILVEYQGVHAEVPVIVYGPYVHVPPYDPQRVVELPPGVEVVVNRVIVRPVADEYDGLVVSQIAADHGGQLIAEWPNLVLFALEFPIVSPDELKGTLLALDADARVAALEVDALYRAADYHDSPESPESATRLGRLPEAWSLLVPAIHSMSTINIAVIDDKLSLDHKDSDIQMVIAAEFNGSRIVHNPTPSRQVSGSSHGLAVASVIGGRGRVPGVLEGINRAASSMGNQDEVPYFLHFYEVGHADFDRVADAVALMSAFEQIAPHENRISVVNISLRTGCEDTIHSQLVCGLVNIATDLIHGPAVPPLDLLRPLIPDVDLKGTSKGVYASMPDSLFVVAAGNANGPAAQSFPAAWSTESANILTVGALNHYEWRGRQAEPSLGYHESSVDRTCIWTENGWKGSNYGPEVSIAAEGTSVYTIHTGEPGGYAYQKGTSFSAPIVSGVAALIRAISPTLTPAEVRAILMYTAREISVDTTRRENCGDAPPSTWRQLDAGAAVSHVLNSLVDAEFSCCALRSAATDQVVDFSFSLTNAGSTYWDFSVNVTATSPSGSEVAILPRVVDGPGGYSYNVSLPANTTQLLRAGFPVDESGEWTIRMRVSRDPFARYPGGLLCSGIIDDQDCLDDIEFTINPGSSTITLAPIPTATPPPTPTPSVSAGWEHSCEVKADGSVVCWGSNGEGQASPPDGEFLSVSAGWAHTCGIRTDRSVVCWGRNEEGQSSAPRRAFISVSAGRVHSCGVRLNGLVECWGENGPFDRTAIPPGVFNSFTSVSAANHHSCGVQAFGTVACWGFDEGGRTMPPPDFFTSVSVGGNHSCGIRTDGSVACWGHNEEGQATPPPGTFVSVSVSKEGLRTCGVRTDGSATCWGAGILVSIVLTDISMPVPIQPDGPFSSISAGYQHVCGLKADGDVACWGTNGRGQAMPPGVSLESVSPGDRHECGLRADGSVACYGYDFFEQTNVPPGSFTSLSVGHSHNCAIKADGSLTCWGWNQYGQATAPAGTFVEVDLGWRHSCGLRESGEIECWGEIERMLPGGEFAALATGANGDGCGILRPEEGSADDASVESGFVECWGDHVSGDYGPPDERFEAIAVGFEYACGIRTDGTVACWGSNPSGKASLPDGQFVAISLGDFHSCGLRSDGEIECWGGNHVGQAEAPDGTFTSISTHANRTCAVRDGRLVRVLGPVASRARDRRHAVATPTRCARVDQPQGAGSGRARPQARRTQARALRA